MLVSGAHFSFQKMVDFVQACKRCDKIHVQYELMMTATGRTVSAAVQIVPYGAVVAKVPMGARALGVWVLT